MKIWVVLNTWKNKKNVSSAVYLYSTKEEAIKWFEHYVEVTKYRYKKEIASKDYIYNEIGDYLFNIHDNRDDYYEEIFLTDRNINEG